MDKLITFTVPCYNSADYMRKCIDSILVGGDDVEIIIVDDGSKDDTAKIADEYAEKYPNIVKVIHKENGGHGSGVNAGLKNASGKFFKVVDSDDWLDEKSLKELLKTVKAHVEKGEEADLYITNYVYEHVADNTSFVSEYRRKFPVGKFFDWNSGKKFYFSHVLMMHSLMYRRQVLIDCNLTLPEHTFYVDNLYAYIPLPCTHKVFYLDVDLYRYFIGRADQSITSENLFKRYDQQVLVWEKMVEAYGYDELMSLQKGLRKYMFHYLKALTAVAEYVVGGKDSPERRKAYKEMWAKVKARDKRLYYCIRYRSYIGPIEIFPWKIRQFFLNASYRFLKRKVKLG